MPYGVGQSNGVMEGFGERGVGGMEGFGELGVGVMEGGGGRGGLRGNPLSTLFERPHPHPLLRPELTSLTQHSPFGIPIYNLVLRGSTFFCRALRSPIFPSCSSWSMLRRSRFKDLPTKNTKN